MKKKIILASTSRYRAELLHRLQIQFEVARPNVDESPLPNENPAQTAERLSMAKARSVAKAFPGALIIGSDQVAELDGAPIGKPGNVSTARLQLRLMRGKSLVFHSGIALLNTETGNVQSSIVPTTVRFRQFSDAEIEHYLKHEDALDCAGSAKSEGLGIALIAEMHSADPTSLVGLPLITLANMLDNEGFGVLT
ncbi:MAG: septum formation inhibitor Maf [Betaproteobacteria bacterium]|nr:septum formation inhibitor Maf [Betaproteobacteria bacterium]